MLPILIQNLLIHCVVEFFPGVVTISIEEVIYLYVCVLYLPSLLTMTFARFLSLTLSLSLFLFPPLSITLSRIG